MSIREDIEFVLGMASNGTRNAEEDSAIERVREYLKAQEWTPCSERMPEELVGVLAWSPHFIGGEPMKGYCYYRDGKPYGWSEYPSGGTFHLGDVTHWKPLPKGPDKDGL